MTRFRSPFVALDYIAGTEARLSTQRFTISYRSMSPVGLRRAYSPITQPVTISSMFNLNAVLTQLRQERDRLKEAIAVLESVTSNGNAFTLTRRGISTEGRRRIAAAQRARWAKLRGEVVVPITKGKPRKKRTISPAARRRIIAAQKARWAKWRKQRKAV